MLSAVFLLPFEKNGSGEQRGVDINTTALHKVRALGSFEVYSSLPVQLGLPKARVRHRSHTGCATVVQRSPDGVETVAVALGPTLWSLKTSIGLSAISRSILHSGARRRCRHT